MTTKRIRQSLTAKINKNFNSIAQQFRSTMYRLTARFIKKKTDSLFPIRFANTILSQLPRTCFAVLVFYDGKPPAARTERRFKQGGIFQYSILDASYTKIRFRLRSEYMFMFTDWHWGWGHMRIINNNVTLLSKQAAGSSNIQKWPNTKCI